MSRSVKINDELYRNAEQFGAVYNRSTAEQIEFWAKIGKIAEDNPDLPYNFVNELLLAKKEIDDGDVVHFRFE